MPSPRGVQRGLPLALLGNFQRCLQCGSENSLISYGIFFVNTLRRAVRLPFGGGCPCRLLTRITPPYFSLPVGGGAVVSVFKGSFAGGGRVQGFPDKYARSEARGRFIGKRRSRLIF
ncbi:MAG: hypothetical protein ACLVK0_18260 [Parabacteroides merdae]